MQCCPGQTQSREFCLCVGVGWARACRNVCVCVCGGEGTTYGSRFSPFTV